MSPSPMPTINDFLSRLYFIRDTAREAVRGEARALIAANAAKGLRASGATLTGLASLVETALESGLAETLEVLRHMQLATDVDGAACRDQALVRTRELAAVLRGVAGIDGLLDEIGSEDAASAIEQRMARLYERIAFRFRQYDVGLDTVETARGETMTPTATRLQQRLSERRAWFNNEWFFKWHLIGGDEPVEIDLFDGRMSSLAGIAFWGSPRDVYWDAISRGLRKEVLNQFQWVEEVAKGYERSVAIQAISQCADLLKRFAAAIRHEAVEKDRILRGDGVNFPPQDDKGRWVGTTDQDISEQAAALTAALFPPAAVLASPAATAAPASPPSQASATPTGASAVADARPYQVALSFAGEQRDYVRDVAKALSARHIAVFYDEFEANSLWGTDGAEHFHRIYSSATQYVVMFISQAYVTKAWTRQERRAAISRQIKSDSEYILPVRFDQAEVPGITDTMQYLMADRFTPAQLAVEIAKKVGVAPTAGKASHVPPPFSSALSGEVTFDYGAYNGRYVIGSGTSTFETAWSKASDAAIHLYNDPSGIHGIALARGATAIYQIEDASAYDFTSRSRTVKVGEIAVLQNIHGFYAAVEVVHIDDDSRGAPSDSLTIRYAVLPTGETNFAALGGAAPS